MSEFNRRAVLGMGVGAGALSLCMSVPAQAQTEEERLHTDWAYLARFRDENQMLRSTGVDVTSVFMGDSITQGWRDKDPTFFVNGRVCRGISGQTTPQMVLRMQTDVIDLAPDIVHIMAGTNDIAGNTGPMTPEMSQANLRSMTELAQANGIRVILASIPPAASFPWRPELEPTPLIIALNTWIAEYARSVDAIYADYHSAMSDGRGGMREGMAYDGVHPDVGGYAVMKTVAEDALTRAARLRRPRLRR